MTFILIWATCNFQNRMPYPSDYLSGWIWIEDIGWCLFWQTNWKRIESRDVSISKHVVDSVIVSLTHAFYEHFIFVHCIVLFLLLAVVGLRKWNNIVLGLCFICLFMPVSIEWNKTMQTKFCVSRTVIVSLTLAFYASKHWMEHRVVEDLFIVTNQILCVSYWKKACINHWSGPQLLTTILLIVTSERRYLSWHSFHCLYSGWVDSYYTLFTIGNNFC